MPSQKNSPSTTINQPVISHIFVLLLIIITCLNIPDYPLYNSYMIPLLVAVFFLLIFLAIGSFLIFKMYKYLLFRNNIFGYTLLARLFTLTTAGYFFKPFFEAFFLKPVLLVKLMAEQVLRGVMMIQEPAKYKALPLVTDLFNRIFKQLNVFDIYVLAGVLMACLIQMALYGLFYDKQTGKYEWQQRINNISNKSKQNVALALLMSGSLYLILCVVIAIPYNNSFSADPEAKTDSSGVNKIVIPQSKELKMTMDGFTKDSVVLFGKINNLKIDQLSTTAMDILKLNNDQVRRSIISRYELLKREVDQYNKAIDNFESEKKQLLDRLNNRLKNNEGSIKLKYAYFQSLQEYITGEIRDKEVVYLRLQSRISDDYSFNISKPVTLFLDEYDDLIKVLEGVKDGQIISPYLKDYFLLNNSPLSFPQLNDVALSTIFWGPQPKEPVPGTDWGWLGQSASWLIMPNAPDLILIIGMFGFGLLGAAISCFVNISPGADGSNTKHPLIQDLHIVIIRGFSAAIVIFLATKGGIAIINNGNNNPNPHVLFFTCLVGAVFSERIWDWAKRQLSLKTDTPVETEKEEIDSPPDLKIPDEGATQGEALPPLTTK
jgi:hypothetical protein